MKVMKTMNVGLFVAAFFLSCVSIAAPVGHGAVISPDRLVAAERSALEQSIIAARISSPAAFESLARLRQELPTLDADKRGRAVPVAAILKGMGKDALLPMLNEIAFDSQRRNGFTDSAWSAWRVGLVEAVGFLRDGRSAPVLTAILDGSDTDFDLIRAAAGALGKLGTDAVAQKLVTMARQKNPKQLAVLSGMGHCRRIAVANELVAALLAQPDAQTAKVVARSLGDIGSAWAWKTPIVQASGEEIAVRSAAAKALVVSYVRYDDDARSSIGKALLMVDYSGTLALIEAQKKSELPERRVLLDELAVRFQKSPLHR
jgi:HEAT repeat protein